MDSQKQKEIARKGGRAAHEKGTAHEFTSEEARAAGRKGGERVSVDRSHMSRIGRIGGKSSAGRRPMASSHGDEAVATRGSFANDSGQRRESVGQESAVASDQARAGNKRTVESLH